MFNRLILSVLKKVLEYFDIPLYEVIGSVPQDDEVFLLGRTFSLGEAVRMAREFVAENPNGFEADIRDINGSTVHPTIGTI